MIGGRRAVMDASRLAGAIKMWESLLGSGGVSVSANSWCGASLMVNSQILLAGYATVSLSQQNYRALSTYPIIRNRWKPMRVS